MTEATPRRVGPLVMVHGACWGIGQSTLSRRLASVLPEVDVLWEDEGPEPAIFTRPEFRDVADRFRRSADGLGHPTPAQLEAAYRRLRRTVLAHGRPTLLAWSVLDLADDLDWARADEGALHRHARDVRAALDPVDPVLVFIDGDPAIALCRAVAQRGRGWFERAYGRPEEPWPALGARLLAEAAGATARARRAFEHGGWTPAIEVDGTASDADTVFRQVVDQLPAVSRSSGAR